MADVLNELKIYQKHYKTEIPHFPKFRNLLTVFTKRGEAISRIAFLFWLNLQKQQCRSSKHNCEK